MEGERLFRSTGCADCHTTVAQVSDFFDSGVQPNPDLDPRLRNSDGSPRRLGLAASEKAALVTFLKTLTDSTFLADPRFSDPFRP